MTGQKTRGTEISKTLRVLAALIRGETLDKEGAAQHAGMKADSVSRNLRLLLEHVPGVSVDTSGRRHLYSFRFEGESNMPAAEERPTVAAAIAMSLGAAFGRVLSGSLYRAEFIRLRDDVVQRLATARKQQFSAMSRKLVVISGHEELLEEKGEILEDVLDAVIRGRRLRMRYETFDGKGSQRTVEPLSLAVYDGHLYLLAVDMSKRNDGVKTFRFARVSDTEVSDEGFPYPALNEYDPAVLLRDSFGIWQGSGDATVIRLRLSRMWAVFVRHHRWHETQRVVREYEDGSVELEVRVRLCPELEQWVLKFGEGAEVLAPQELRDTIAARLRSAAHIYQTR